MGDDFAGNYLNIYLKYVGRYELVIETKGCGIDANDAVQTFVRLFNNPKDNVYTIMINTGVEERKRGDLLPLLRKMKIYVFYNDHRDPSMKDFTVTLCDSQNPTAIKLGHLRASEQDPKTDVTIFNILLRLNEL